MPLTITDCMTLRLPSDKCLNIGVHMFLKNKADLRSALTLVEQGGTKQPQPNCKSETTYNFLVVSVNSQTVLM